MTAAFTPTPRTRVKRIHERGHYDRETVYAILDAVIDSFLPVIARIEDGIDEAEAAVLTRADESDVRTLIRLRRDLADLRRTLYPLRNVFENPHIGLIFLIPTLEETLRVNGKVAIVRDEALLADRELGGKPAKVGLGVEVEEAFLHCAKAFKRSGLWQPEEWQSLDGLARPAEIWRDHMALPGMTTEGVQEYLDDDYSNNLVWQS